MRYWLMPTGLPMPLRTSDMDLSTRISAAAFEVPKLRKPTRPPKKLSSLVTPSHFKGMRLGERPRSSKKRLLVSAVFSKTNPW